ncbi:MAG: DUF1127 domain-containing protein [Rhodospirillales bacterium]|nr:DUF1127 domain-containing protein [Rhodospirillales bacterium]
MTQQTVFENHLAAPSTISLRERDRIVRDAQRMQAEIMAQTVSATGRAVWRTVKWIAGGVAAFFIVIDRAVIAQRTFLALNDLSDRQLEDIGLTRDGIRDRVQGILDVREIGSPDPAEEFYAVEGGLSGKSRKPRFTMPRRRAA